MEGRALMACLVILAKRKLVKEKSIWSFGHRKWWTLSESKSTSKVDLDSRSAEKGFGRTAKGVRND